MTEETNNVTPIRQITPDTIRKYDHKDGGYILISEKTFSELTEQARADYTLNDHIPNAVEIAEWRSYQRFHNLWQDMVNRLEDSSAGRPKVFTKKGNPIKWRYSTHDIANVLTWCATASNERIREQDKTIAALQAEIKRLKGEF